MLFLLAPVVCIVLLYHHGMISVILCNRNDSSPFRKWLLKGAIDHQKLFVALTSAAANEASRIGNCRAVTIAATAAKVFVHVRHCRIPPTASLVQSHLSLRSCPKRKSIVIAVAVVGPQLGLHRPIPRKRPRGKPFDRFSHWNHLCLDS